MTPPPTKPKTPELFDQAKLESMIEPFTVRVERQKGQSRSPIPMPAPMDGEGAPGTGFSREDIMGIERWLIADWCGGGILRVTVTDSDSPKPSVMSWMFTSELPERVPPPLQAATQAAIENAQAVRQQAANPQQRAPYMASFPNGLPTGNQMTPYPAPGYAPAPAPGWQHVQPTAPPGYYQQPAPVQQPQQMYNPYERQLEAMREQLAASERERLTVHAEQKRLADQAANDQRFSRLEGALNSLVDKIGSLVTGASKNPELELMRQKLEESEREKREDRREQATREAMRTQYESTMKMIETMQAQFQAAQIAAQTRGPDPMIQLMQEQMRQSIEAQKEMARNQADSLKNLTGFMLSPRDMIALQKDASSGADTTAAQLNRMYGDMISVQTRLLEQTAQLNSGGGRSAIDVVETGVEKLTSLAQRWVQGKSAAEKAGHDAQAMQAQAQARAVEAQASVYVAQQQAQAAVATAGLSGAGAVEHHAAPVAPQIPAGVAGLADANGNGQVIPMRGNAGKIGGRTTEEWFGPFAEEVGKLRDGVKLAIESVTASPPRVDADGRLIGTTPEMVVGSIADAVELATQHKLPIPALLELFNQERWADFVDVLLPEAPEGYKANVIQLLAADEGGEEDDEEQVS